MNTSAEKTPDKPEATGTQQAREQDYVVIEAHHLVYSYCERLYHKQIRRDLHERPLEIRRRFFCRLARGRTIRVERRHLLDYLDHLSNGFSKGLAGHSPYFWLFLYGRIKPVLSPHHDNITDSQTTLLVRQILELAMLKHGDLEKVDLRPTSHVPFEERWGGYLKLAIDYLDENQRKFVMTAYGNADPSDESLLPVEFGPADYRAIYANEGLAYEYWLCTARLRSIGKGMRLWFDPQSANFTYEPSPEISTAIERFDARLKGIRVFPTLIGISTPDSSAENNSFFKLFSASYNTEGSDLSSLLASLGVPGQSLDGGNLINFVPSLLDVNNFIEAHTYLDEAFRAVAGVGLEDFMYVLWALSNLALIPNRSLRSEEIFKSLMLQLLRRGYAIYSMTLHELLQEITGRISTFPNLGDDKRKSIEKSAQIALGRVMLTSELQRRISPWSGGPRPIVVPFDGRFVIDVVGNLEFLARMFTGVEDDGTIRGGIFEATVRSVVTASISENFEWGPRKIYENNILVDEIDLMLRRKHKVYVCECFSMWRPLDFEIGNEKTISGRTDQINKKIDQATETCQFLLGYRKGSNYDYADVTEFVPIVVSPFIEWVPTTDSRYWISDTCPRVMSVDELVDYLAAEDGQS